MKNKKITVLLKKIIIYAFLSFAIIIIYPQIAHADAGSIIDGYTASQVGDQKALVSKFQSVINTITTIGTGVSVIALIMIGIRYVVGSIDEKADYKEKMIPYLIGITFVYGITSIVDMIGLFSTQIIKGDIGTITSNIIKLLGIIGKLASTGCLGIIGIKYMNGSVEEKAEYKGMFMPYFIGSVIIFAASEIAPIISNQILEIIKAGGNINEGGDINIIVNNIGNGIVGVITTIGMAVSLAILVVLGIKYMMGSIEEKAEYKKTMQPYLLGSIIVFATLGIVNYIQSLANSNITSGSTIAEIGKNIFNIVSIAGSIISVIALIAIGIKYMMGGTEEKAEYKKTLLPYTIGAVIVFAASTLYEILKNMVQNNMGTVSIETTGGQIISILSVIGSILSVVCLVVIGIRYMFSSVEEKAEYKKTLLPYVIGATIVFATSVLASAIYQFASNLHA